MDDFINKLRDGTYNFSVTDDSISLLTANRMNSCDITKYGEIIAVNILRDTGIVLIIRRSHVVIMLGDINIADIILSARILTDSIKEFIINSELSIPEVLYKISTYCRDIIGSINIPPMSISRTKRAV